MYLAKIRTHNRLHTSAPFCCKGGAFVPFHVEACVSEDVPAGQEAATQTGQDLPVAEIPQAVRVWYPGRLLDNLTVNLVPQGFQIVARLQDTLWWVRERIWDLTDYTKMNILTGISC